MTNSPARVPPSRESAADSTAPQPISTGGTAGVEQSASAVSIWQTIECERVLYVDRGNTIILCDRLPSPLTLVVKRRA